MFEFKSCKTLIFNWKKRFFLHQKFTKKKNYWFLVQSSEVNKGVNYHKKITTKGFKI